MKTIYMIFKILYIINLIICIPFSVNTIDTLFFENNCEHYIFPDELVHFVDSTNNLSFSTIQTKRFSRVTFPEFLPIQYTY